MPLRVMAISLGFDIGLVYQALITIAILVVTYIIGLLAARIVKTSLRKVKFYQPEIIMAASVTKYFIYLMGILVVLGYIGIQVTTILVGFVVIILILSLAARSALENIAAWYVLRTWAPFDSGDLVMIGKETGVVKETDPLRTTIETPHRLRYSVPNTKLLGSELYNYGQYDEDFPVLFHLNVPSTRKVEALKLKIVDIIGTYPQLSRNKPIQVVVEEISDNRALLSVIFLVPELGLIKSAKDYVLSRIMSLPNIEDLNNKEDNEKNKDKPNVFQPAALSRGQKCRMCDSTGWEGHLRCRVCRSYFADGRCLSCDSLRLEKCPLDGGDLEYIEME